IEIAQDRRRFEQREIAVRHRRDLAEGIERADGAGKGRHQLIVNALLVAAHAHGARKGAGRHAIDLDRCHHTALPTNAASLSKVPFQPSLWPLKPDWSANGPWTKVSSVLLPSARKVTSTVVSWPSPLVQVPPAR